MNPAVSFARSPGVMGRPGADEAETIARTMLDALERPAVCRLLNVVGGADFSRIDDHALVFRLALALRSGAVEPPGAAAGAALTCWVTLSGAGGRAVLSSEKLLSGFQRWRFAAADPFETAVRDLLARPDVREAVLAFLLADGGRWSAEDLASDAGLAAACLKALRTDRLRLFRPMRRAREEPVTRAVGKSEDGQKPLARPSDTSAPVDHWIEIILVDEDGTPLSGEPYELTMPGGELRTGSLDDDGRARCAGLKQAGSCKVAFPRIDAREWRAA